MLYGLSLLYGLTGTTSLPADPEFLAAGLPEPEPPGGRTLITLLVLAGFGFKTAAVPFHFWCPDVYQGAPTPVTAFLSVAPKAAGLRDHAALLLRGHGHAGTGPWDLAGTIDWPQLLMVVSVLTMTVGNVAALTQTNMKRLLAYSSIAHAGFIMMGVVALSANGARGLMIYLLAYVFMNLGAFLVVTLVHLHDGTFDLRDYPGLYRRAPLLDRGHGHLPALARGHPAPGGLHGQALRVRGRHRARPRVLVVRGGGRGERGHRRLLLLRAS